MYNTKNLRRYLTALISDALEADGATGWPVCNGCDSSGARRVVLFQTYDLSSLDERERINLEINVIGPQSDMDSIEAATDAILKLDRYVSQQEDCIFYLYKSTRNRIDGGDGHTVRYRCTFDLYLYERS